MFKKILMASLLVISSSAVMAVPMVGGFNMNDVTVGSGNSVTWTPGSNDVAFLVATDNFEVVGATGTFSGLNGTLGTINDFNYGALPQVDLFSFSTFAFTLTSLYEVYEGSSLALGGYGTLSDSTMAYDDTVFAWTFSATPEGKGTWSASAVPGPATLVLLGFGLIGMALTQRRNKRAV